MKPTALRIDRRLPPTIFGILAVMFSSVAAFAAEGHGHGLNLPAWAELVRVLTFQDYNTRVVIIGATLLGLAAGLVGTFLLLRKRALLSDTLSHATLPGIALAFIVVSALGGEGKNLLTLILGAAVFSILGTGSVMAIQRFTRLKDDAALGIVLSVFFGLGIALMGIATRMETGNAAGLSSFIYGKTASMLFFDAVLIAATAFAVALFTLLFFKEFTIICFDQSYAASQGWPVFRLDFLLMALVVMVTVIGLQAVGLILVVALLIIPPAAARFWTYRLGTMLALSGLFGAFSGLFGAAFSALMANLPAGAVIVLTAAALFIFSLTFGSKRGLIRQISERRKLKQKIGRENLLRSLFEIVEQDLLHNPAAPPETIIVPVQTLLPLRAWSSSALRKLIAAGENQDLIHTDTDDNLEFTTQGWKEAFRVVRNHRLWETYLITHADVAPSQVDWGADQIEHILDPEIIMELEAQSQDMNPTAMPLSPHALAMNQGEL